MKIAHITPGSGDNFYCENCLRDLALIRAFGKAGHEIVMVPMYLPPAYDENEPVNRSPIFFGGINVYLQQRFGLFRKTPRSIDRLFDRGGLLRWAGRKAHMTTAKDLGETTISMLRGEDGRQVKELTRLVQWLGRPENKPDIVCLSNILLVGLARRIKSELGVGVVCLLQDEDAFLETLGQSQSDQAWQILAERAEDIDAFIAVSSYYASVIRQRLPAAESVQVVHMGIGLDVYDFPLPEPETATIGYLSRMCPDKGLDTLAEAFVIIKKDERLRNARLRIAGGKTANDESFIDGVRRRLQSCGLIDDVEFLSDFNRDARLRFLQTLSVLAVPEKRPVACGLYVLEALAAGVPVVQPDAGVFTELLGMTGGGLLCEPNNANALAQEIQSLLLDRPKAQRLGKQGRKVVFEKFNIDGTAKEMVLIYEGIIRNFR